MSGSKSRNKGKRGEREVVNLLREWGWQEVKREWSIQSEISSGVDVSVQDPPLSIQVKFTAQPPIAKGYFEAKRDCAPGTTPVCFSRKVSREGSGEWLVTMSADDFRRLSERARLIRG